MLFLTESLHTVIKTIFSSKLEYWKSWQCLDQYITCTCRLLFVSFDSFSIIISTRSDGIMKAKFRGLQGCNNLNQKSKMIHIWELRLNTYHLSLYIPHRVALTPLPLQMSMPLHFYWQIYEKEMRYTHFLHRDKEVLINYIKAKYRYIVDNAGLYWFCILWTTGPFLAFIWLCEKSQKSTLSWCCSPEQTHQKGFCRKKHYYWSKHTST